VGWVMIDDVLAKTFINETESMTAVSSLWKESLFALTVMKTRLDQMPYHNPAMKCEVICDEGTCISV